MRSRDRNDVGFHLLHLLSVDMLPYCCVLIIVCLLVVMRVREDREQESAFDLQGHELDGSEQQWEGKWSLTHIAPC